MKKIILLFFIGLSFYTNAQVAKPKVNTLKCEICAGLQYTVVSQFTDVKTTDAFYGDLQSLVERYGIDLAACNKQTFGGKQILTTAMVIQMLNTSLDMMAELVSSAIDEVEDDKREKINEELKPKGFDMYGHSFLFADKIKDLRASDCYYQHAESLLEKYNIDLTNKTGLLAATKPANGKNMALLLKQVFGLSDFDTKKYSAVTITKGTFVIMLNKALDEYNDRVSEAID